MSTKTVPVSRRALIQRINRALRKDDKILKTARSERVRLDLGDYYIINTRRNLLTDKQIDLESLGRELDALADYERLED